MKKRRLLKLPRYLNYGVYQLHFLTILQNKALLKTLGLEKPLNEPKLSLKMTLKRKSSPDTEHVDVPTPKIQRVRVQTEMDKESTALRRSSRNSGKKVDYSNLQSTGLPQPLIRDKISGNEGSMGREAGQRIHDPLSCSLALEVAAVLILVLRSEKPLDIFQVLLSVLGGWQGRLVVEMPFMRRSFRVSLCLSKLIRS